MFVRAVFRWLSRTRGTESGGDFVAAGSFATGVIAPGPGDHTGVAGPHLVAHDRLEAQRPDFYL